jgi:hypothetical protein
MTITWQRNCCLYQEYDVTRTRFILLLLSASALPLKNALACIPPPYELFESTEKRVRERYALAESVELATIVDVQPISQPDRYGNTLVKGERVTFRLDKIYKGKSRPGDQMVVESIGMCAYSVAGNAALKNTQSPEGWIVIPPRQWLFYRRAGSSVSIGENDMARPINQVGFDLQLLERWRKQSSR